MFLKLVLAVLVFIAVRGLSLVVASRGFSVAVALLAAEHGRYSVGSVVEVYTLSCPVACGIFLIRD